MIRLWRNRGDLAEKIATVLSRIAFVSLKSLKNEAAKVLSYCSIAPKKIAEECVSHSFDTTIVILQESK